MPDNPRQQSAQHSAAIYQFPVGGRASLFITPHRNLGANEFKSPNVAELASADAWYHQEAIRDARLAGKP